MLLEFYKKRLGIHPVQYTFIAGSGHVVLLKWMEPTEVEDEIAYKILGEASDIVRKVEAPKEAKKKRGPNKKNVVESFTTA